MIGVALRCVCEIGVAQHGCGDSVIDRGRMYVTCIVRLLDYGDAISPQRRWNVIFGDRNRRLRRPHIYQPTLSTQMKTTLPFSRFVVLPEKIQTIETRGEERCLPRVEPVRTQIDVLRKQPLELRGRPCFETGDTVFHLFECE